MLNIKKKYIINENNDRVAVQLDIKAFEKIERLLEEHLLIEKIKENRKEDRMEVKEAKAFYNRIKKTKR
jgi:CO dehydrogenase/acetyl-CoA synthase beta subunit